MSRHPGAVSTSTDPGRRRRWWGLLVISLGVAMIIVDATIVNVAIPRIIADLHITSTDAQWVQDIYTLVFAALLLSTGRLADRLGRRRIFLIGIAVFMAASLAAADAGSAPALIAARLGQGCGGALILPASLSLINTGFRGRDRNIAFAVWGSTIGAAAALGPLLGGWLTTALSWRWAFGINLGAGLVVLVGVALLISESRGTASGYDWPGALLTAIGLGGIVFALIQGRSDGWWHTLGAVNVAGFAWTGPVSPVPIAAVIGVVAVSGFLLRQHRRGRRGRAVLLDLELFRIRSFRNGNLAALIVSLGEFGILFAIPLWLQNVRGLSAFETGLVLLPLAVGSFAASGAVSVLARTRGPLFVVRCGIVLELAGVAGLGFVVGTDTAIAVLVAPLLVYGAGVGMATAQLTGVILADVPVEQSGQGSATQSTARQIGSALGIAVLGTILFGLLGTGLGDRLPAGTPPAARHSLVSAVDASAGAVIPALQQQPDIAAAARAAFSAATETAAFSAAGFLLIGLLATTRLTGAGRAEGESVHRQEENALQR